MYSGHTHTVILCLFCLESPPHYEVAEKHLGKYPGILGLFKKCKEHVSNVLSKTNRKKAVLLKHSTVCSLDAIFLQGSQELPFYLAVTTVLDEILV